MKNQITEKLKQASAGLMMMSESDYPFEVVSWNGEAKEPLTPQKLLHLTDNPEDSLVEEVSLEDFFSNCAYEQEWYDEQQKQDVKKFQHLLQTIKDNLKEIKVYRVGKRKINVYILGKAANEDLAGVSTILIET